MNINNKGSSRMSRHIFARHPANGQSLPLMALFAVVIFVFTGFAIDGGLLYAQRRVMQNTSDAACLAAANRLALNQTSTQATTAAQQIVLTNLGATPGSGVNAPGTLSYTAVGDIYSPQAGSGTSLTKGIEIDGADVRVALQSPANTFFMRVVGISNYTVAAKSHCDAKAGGGGLPFAVARWRGYDSGGDIVYNRLTTNQTLPQAAGPGAGAGNMTVRDIIRTEGSSVITQWPGWGSTDYPGDPDAGTSLYSSPSPAASEASPGPEVPIAGAGARPNGGDTSFRGPIVLDYRQTTFPQPLFYNGLTPTTALNTYKDFLAKYIYGPYPGPVVIPGQQIGYYNGVSAGQVIDPFNTRYKVGDRVSVLIYNGTIYSDPDFEVRFPSPANASDSLQSRSADSFTTTLVGCAVPSGYTFDGQSSSQTTRKNPAAYRINLLPQTYSTFKLRAFLSTDPTSWGEMMGRWNGGSWQDFNINGAGPVISINTSGQNLTFDARPDDTFSCTDTSTGTTTEFPMRKNGAQTIYLEAQDTGTGKRRGVYVLLNQNADTNDFYAYFAGTPVTNEPLEPGNSTSAELTLTRVGGSTDLDLGSGSTKVQAGTIQWYDPGNLSTALASGATYNGVSVTVDHSGSRDMVSIDASNSATTGKSYYLRIPLTYGGFTHHVWYYFSVRPELSNASGIDQFVYALGYATFKITYSDSNDIRGRAVSGLMREPEDIISGFQPRLVAWDS
jgi:Flp pilus assembly protein TadG